MTGCRVNIIFTLLFTRKYKLADSTMYKDLEICLQNQQLTIWFSKLISVHGKKAYFPLNPYPTAFPYGNGMVLHFYQQQESSTTKTVHKVINKGLKTYV